MRLDFHPDAVAEIRSAAFWYGERRDGLGDEFVDDVDRIVVHLLDFPTTFASWPGLADPQRPIRRALVSRFPYAIAFETSEQAVLALAVAHAKQRPLYWLKRAERPLG